MMKFSTKIILMCVALMFSAGGAFALPQCPSDTKVTWSNCVGNLTNYADGNKYVGEFRDGKRTGQGTYTWSSSGNKYVGEFRDGKLNGQGTYTWGPKSEWAGDKYVGEWRDNKYNGQGTYTYANGTVKEGIWKDDKFQYAQKTPYSSKPSLLQVAFTQLSQSQRKQVQSILSNLGFYNSSIDGLYGKGTAKALTSYNKQNLNGADLTKNENAGKLINAILSLEPSPSTQPKLADNATPDQTYKVASGTGFYVSDQGHIITNNHVIDGCTDMKVHSKGLTVETVQIATDAQNDLALLKVSEIPTYAFALSTTSPYSLQDIIVAGFPFGDRVSSTLKFTQGIVSSIAGIGNNYSEIQIDAALQPGNSGGPIMDEYGNIIAVAVAKLDVKTIIKDYGVVPENTNFGVKASAVRNLMEGNGVKFKAPNTEVMSKQDLSRNATEGTVYLTCWMTMAQIEKLRTKKVMFESLE
jgi:S1-C subfamily serine protease